MSALSVDELACRPLPELEERLRAAKTRVDDHVTLAVNEGRDLSEREAAALFDDRAEIGQLKLAIELQERSRDRAAQIGAAIEQHTRRDTNLSPLMVSARNLAILEEARSRFSSVTVIEERAALKTTDMGTAVEYGAGGLQAPRSLWRSSGIPTTAPVGYGGVTPQFSLPAGVAPVSEGTDHAEFDGVSPDTVTIARAGAWSSLSSEAMLSTSIAEVSAAHARIVARNLDVAAVTKIEQTPDALDIDEALVTVAAECACDVSDLWIVGQPTAVAALAGNATFTPASGSDVGSFATRYGGAAIYPTPAATIATLTVFHPQSFKAFASQLASAVTIDPSDGSQTFGQWMFFGLGQALVGSAITIDGQGS